MKQCASWMIGKIRQRDEMKDGGGRGATVVVSNCVGDETIGRTGRAGAKALRCLVDDLSYRYMAFPQSRRVLLILAVLYKVPPCTIRLAW